MSRREQRESSFFGIERSVSDLAGVRIDATTALTPEILEEAARLILETPPPPPCGVRENPHLVSPKPTRFPVCVRCGAGALDAVFAKELERMGVLPKS